MGMGCCLGFVVMMEKGGIMEVDGFRVYGSK